MSATVALSALPIGARAVVKDYPKSNSAFLRLRELGLAPGVTVTLVRAAPLGDPLEIKIRTAHLSLRRSEADQISVEPAP
jgi:ferrous iron transport protein A